MSLNKSKSGWCTQADWWSTTNVWKYFTRIKMGAVCMTSLPKTLIFMVYNTYIWQHFAVAVTVWCRLFSNLDLKLVSFCIALDKFVGWNNTTVVTHIGKGFLWKLFNRDPTSNFGKLPFISHNSFIYHN